MLLSLLLVSVPDKSNIWRKFKIVTALNFDLWMLPAHMIFELIHPPEPLEAFFGTSLGKTVVGSGTALVGLVMAEKVAFAGECLVAIYNAALVSRVRLGPRNSGWWFAIGPVLKDQSLLVIWFCRMQIAGRLSRFALRQSLVEDYQRRQNEYASACGLSLTALLASSNVVWLRLLT